MIDEKMIDKIDVCRKFFGVDDGAVSRYSVIFGMDNSIHMNKVMSRSEAVRLVKMDCGIEKRNIISKLYISSDVVQAYRIRDFTGKKIFSLADERICGWFMQYDPTPYANWCHRCWYYLVVNKDCFDKVESKHGLCESINMETMYQGKISI